MLTDKKLKLPSIEAPMLYIVCCSLGHLYQA